MYTYMKMKRKQDPPTSPFYTTPRVYLYMLTSSEQEFFEHFVPATCPTKFQQELNFVGHVAGKIFAEATPLLVCERLMQLVSTTNFIINQSKGK